MLNLLTVMICSVNNNDVCFIETIIAEKLQSVLDKKIGNSRMKDFYDLYYFVHFKWNEINVDHLKEAVEKHLSIETHIMI